MTGVSGRKARVALSDPRLTSPQTNAIARRFRIAFSEAFRENILPEGRKFEPVRAELYVPDREWKAEEHERPSTDHPYEDLLDKQFWELDRPRLVILVGEVGIGKSTLLDFYLRSHCPSQHELLFDEKLIVNVDLRNVVTDLEFDSVLFQRLRTLIINTYRACDRDIVSENCYEMWDSYAAGWDTHHHVEQQSLAAMTTEEYRGNLVNKVWTNIDDSTFVRLALEYISSQLLESETSSNQSAKPPFEYIVLCFDNLDQSPLNIIEHALTLLRRWMSPNDGLKVWRVYVPVWPETYAIIANSLAPLPTHEIIPIGAPNHERLLHLRFEAGRTRIGNEGSEVVLQKDPGDSGPIGKISNSGCQDYVSTAFRDARPEFLKAMSLLAADNTRRLISLWRTVLSSLSLERNFAKVQKSGTYDFASIGAYALFDALFTGYFRLHHRLNSPIANIFYAHTDESCNFPLLSGIHVLQLLRQHVTEEDKLCSCLLSVGYDIKQTKSVLNYFASKSLIRRYSRSGQMIIDVDDKVLQGYANLLVQPAYLDNMAMVTPVDSEICSKIAITVSFTNSDFVSRCSSTIAFLRQIQKDEHAFFQAYRTLQSRSEVDHRVTLQSICPDLATAYRNRLSQLRAKNYLPHVTQTNWDYLINSDVLVVAMSEKTQIEL